MAKDKVCRVCDIPIAQSAPHGGGRICDPCHTIYRKQKKKESRERHREKRLQQEARLREQPERKEFLKAYMGPYGKEYYRAHKERHYEQVRRWKADNPDKRRASDRRSEHHRRSAIGTYTDDQLKARIDFYGHRCYLCGCDWDALDPFDQTIEHVIPVSKGGTNWPANLRPACRPCNSSKGAKTQTGTDYAGSL